MKRATRKQIAKAFKAAKPYLKTYNTPVGVERTSFICFALEYSKTPCYVVDAAARVIMDRLHPNSTVYGWLLHQAKIPKHDLTPENVQAYRHRWLDSLIKEFSK